MGDDDKQKPPSPQVVDLGKPVDLAIGASEQEHQHLQRRALLIPAIKRRLDAGDRPGENIGWKEFGNLIRADINKTEDVRGYGDQRIRELVAEIRRP
jgi:hypothetical protein